MIKARILPVNGRVGKSRQVPAFEVSVESEVDMEGAIADAIRNKLPRDSEIVMDSSGRRAFAIGPVGQDLAEFKIYREGESNDC